MSNLYIPMAPPGAGKSYTARKMVENGIIDGDAIVEPDRYREILSGDRACQEVNGRVFKIVDTLVLTRLEQGLDVYLDATNLNRSAFRKLLDRLPGNVKLTLLTCDVDKDTLYERNRGREHSVPEHVIDRMWDQWVDMPLIQDIYNPNIATLSEAQTWRS